MQLQTADVGAISARLQQDRSVISRHLKTLREAGVVFIKVEGSSVIYTLEGAGLVHRLEHMAVTIRAAMSSCCPEQLSEL